MCREEIDRIINEHNGNKPVQLLRQCKGETCIGRELKLANEDARECREIIEEKKGHVVNFVIVNFLDKE